MMTINVLENYKNEQMVEFILDGENVGSREMNQIELMATINDARKKIVNVTFEEPTELQVVTMSEYDGEYDIEINTYTFSSVREFDFRDETVKTYKREKAAFKKMREVASQLGCTYEESNC
jgi:hypothetical protein